MNDSIKDLIGKVVAFRDARNWKQFHNPKDIAISISLEAAELLEIFQWSGPKTNVDTDVKMTKIREELADVLMYCLIMSNDLGLDISEIIEQKIEANNRKYPVEKAYGRADKYTAYIEDSDRETGKYTTHIADTDGRIGK